MTPMQKRATDHSTLRLPESWSAGTARLIVAAAETGGATRSADVDIKSVYYTGRSVGIFLGLIPDPNTGRTYVVRGGQSFYVSNAGGLFSCMVSSGSVILTRSVFDERSTVNERELLGRFVSAVDHARLVEWSKGTAIDLKVGVPFSFWTAHGGFDSQPGSPSIIGVEIARGHMQLDLRSEDGRHQGSFWIALADSKLLRSVIDGKEVFRAPA